jgi:hypothetical protein
MTAMVDHMKCEETASGRWRPRALPDEGTGRGLGTLGWDLGDGAPYLRSATARQRHLSMSLMRPKGPFMNYRCELSGGGLIV